MDIPNHAFTREGLIDLPREQDVFVGIDSDGCVFDSMAAKQIQCFHRGFLEVWNLHAFEAPVRDTLEFVNLRSAYRGRDRFLNLALAVSFMRERPELAAAPLPDTTGLDAWLSGDGPFGNRELSERVAAAPADDGLAAVLRWSRLIDTYVAELGPVPPFAGAVAFLEQATSLADLLVVSSTPLAVLIEEWTSHNLRRHVRFIAGKDLGEKSDHLKWATNDKGYRQTLMIGDAPKDLQAAREAGVAFFPMMPGAEEASWRTLLSDILPALCAGEYTRERERLYEQQFLQALPEQPPWR